MKKRTKKTIREKKDTYKQLNLQPTKVQSKAKAPFHAKRKLNFSKILVNTDSNESSKQTHADTVVKTLEFDNLDAIKSNIVTNGDNSVSICPNKSSFEVKKSSKKGSEKKRQHKQNFPNMQKQNFELDEASTCMNNKLCVRKKNGEPFSSILTYVKNTAEEIRIKTDNEREQDEMNNFVSISNDSVKTETIQHDFLKQPQETKINEKLETLDRKDNGIKLFNEIASVNKDKYFESLYFNRSEIDYKILLKIKNTNKNKRSNSNELKQEQKGHLRSDKSRIYRLLNRAKQNILASGPFLEKLHTNKYNTQTGKTFFTHTEEKLNNEFLNKNWLALEKSFTQKTANEEIENQNTYKIEAKKINKSDSNISSENDIKKTIHDISQIHQNAQNFKNQDFNSEINDYLNIHCEEQMNTDTTNIETAKSYVVLNETDSPKKLSSVDIQTDQFDFQDSKNCISGSNQGTDLEQDDSRINIITQNMVLSKNKRKKRGKKLHKKNTVDFLYKLQLLLKNVNVEFFQEEEHLRLLILEYNKLLSEIKNDQRKSEYVLFFDQIVNKESFFDNNSETCLQKIKIINDCQLFKDFGKPEIKIIFYEQKFKKLQETINEIKHINNLLLKSESNDHRIISNATKDERTDETSSSQNTLMKRTTENPTPNTVNETILNPDLGLHLKNLFENGDNEEMTIFCSI